MVNVSFSSWIAKTLKLPIFKKDASVNILQTFKETPSGFEASQYKPAYSNWHALLPTHQSQQYSFYTHLLNCFHTNVYSFRQQLPVHACYTYVCWDSTGSTATCYGLDCPGIESWWGQNFLHLSRLALGPTQPPVKWVPGLCLGKANGAWCWHTIPSSAKVNETVWLQLYSPYGPLWPVLWSNLPFPFRWSSG